MSGEINARVRNFLHDSLWDFTGRRIVVGASGGFHLESVLAHAPHNLGVYSNDNRMLPCLIGRWLTGRSLGIRAIEPGYAWVQEFLTDDIHTLAAAMVLEEMLVYEPRVEAKVAQTETQGRKYHRERAWAGYRGNFGALVRETVQKLNEVDWQIAEFREGDVFDHFHALRDDPDAVFCFNEASYVPSLTRAEKRMTVIFKWDGPFFVKTSAVQLEALRGLVQKKNFVWIAKMPVPGWKPFEVFQQRPSSKDWLYIYSNVIGQTTYHNSHKIRELPKIPMADHGLEIGFKSKLQVKRILLEEMLALKDAFLAKKVFFGRGDWAFGVFIDGKLIGAFEYQKDWKGGKWLNTVILYSFFALPHTKYKRLSKLVVMAALAKETGEMVRRFNEYPVEQVTTTMYTEHDSHMLTRGIMEKTREGWDSQKKKVLVYGAKWSELSWKQSLHRWIQKWSKTQADKQEISPSVLVATFPPSVPVLAPPT